MDPFSLSTGIAGFIGVALQITEALQKYISGVSSAKKDAQALLAQIGALIDVLRQFQDFLRREELKGILFKPTSGLCSVVALCQHELQSLLGKLSKVSSLGKHEISIALLTWPFDSKGIQQSIQTLQQCMGIFHFSLTIDNCALMSKSNEEILSSLKVHQQQLEQLTKMLGSVPADMVQLSAEIGMIISFLPDISDMSTNINSIYTGVQRLQLDLDAKFLQWLSPLEPTKRHQDVRSIRLEGTGEWLLKSLNFESWLIGTSQDSDRILCCYGIPGAGKTVMSSLVVDHLTKLQAEAKQAGHQNVTVAYLYCDYRDQDNQTLRNIIGSLLRQVVTAMPSLNPKNLEQTYRFGTHLGLSDIEATLRDICKAGKAGQLYICIDALDECKDRDILLKSLKELLSYPSVKLFTTSRPHIQALMDKHFKGTLRITIEASEEDIKNFVAAEIEKDREDDPDLMDERLKLEFLQSIAATTQGMFLLPALQVRAVLNERTKSKRRLALKRLPHELGQAYESAFERIKQQPKGTVDEAMNIMMWVHLALRPLTVNELRYALAVTPDDTIFDDDNLPSVKSWLAGCSGLVVVDDETGTVRLVHFSLQEYLSTQSGEFFKQGHARITLICLTYMNLIDSSQLSWFEAFPQALKEKRDFLEYCGNNWGIHFRKSHEGVYPDLSDRLVRLSLRRFRDCERMATSKSRFFLAGRSLDAVWHSDVYVRNNDTHRPLTEGLSFASYFGMVQVVDAILKTSDGDVNARLGGLRSALSLAAQQGHLEVVKILVYDGRADMATMDRNAMTPLHWAATEGHPDVVKFLRERGAEVDTMIRREQEAIWAACSSGHLKVVEYFIKELGADVEAQDIVGDTILAAAAWSGQLHIVKFLINDCAAKPNSRNVHWVTPLNHAVNSHHLEVVRFLVEEAGADMNVRDDNDRTPSDLAKEKGYEDIIKYFNAVC